MFLEWDPPPPDQINGVLQGYRINISEIETGDVLQHVVNRAEAIIGSLHPYYTYYFTVIAFTEVGGGPTTHVTVRTDEDGQIYLYIILVIKLILC